MRTAVLSDLHLGVRSGADVLGRPAVRRRLLDALAGVDRVVLLGDVLELRERSTVAALELARPFFDDLGEALGEAEVVLVPGNHDHGLAAPVVDRAGGPGRLGLEERMAPPAGHPLARLADRLRLTLAYPGLWLADGVYATHGHYLNLHLSVPTFETLAVGAMARMVGEPPDAAATPSDYERVLAPVYRAATGVGQLARPGGAAVGANVSARVWERVSAEAAGAGAPTLPVKLLAGALPGAVGALNRLGLGPYAADFSGAALRGAHLRAMGEVVRRLGIEADLVVFGHTHRTGPLAGEDAWLGPEGARLLNTGNWVHEPAFLGGAPGASPYWPGGCLFLDERGEPQLRRLLADVDPGALRLDAA